MVKAVYVAGGYLIDGTAPWITGWRILNSFVLGATLPNGHHLYAYVPINDDKNAMKASPPMRLAVINASDTVEVTFRALFVPDEHTLYERPAIVLRQSDLKGITTHVDLPLGCARGSVFCLRTLARERAYEPFVDVADRLQATIGRVRADAIKWNSARADLADYKVNALRARAAAILVAVKAAHAAVAAAGGTAHLTANPPQRLVREAMFYTTLAQTLDVRTGTLDLLLSPECQPG